MPDNAQIGLQLLSLQQHQAQAKQEADALRQQRQRQGLLASQKDAREAEEFKLKFQAQKEEQQTLHATQLAGVLANGIGFVSKSNPGAATAMAKLKELTVARAVKGPEGQEALDASGSPVMSEPSTMLDLPDGYLFTKPSQKGFEDFLKRNKEIEDQQFDAAKHAQNLTHTKLQMDHLQGQIQNDVLTGARPAQHQVRAAAIISKHVEDGMNAERAELTKTATNPSDPAAAAAANRRLLDLGSDPSAYRVFAAGGLYSPEEYQKSRNVFVRSVQDDPAFGHLADYHSYDEAASAASSLMKGRITIRQPGDASSTQTSALSEIQSLMDTPVTPTSPSSIKARKSELLQKIKSGTISPAELDEARKY